MPPQLEFILRLIPQVLGLLIGGIAGRIIEKKHYASIVQREAATVHIPAVALKRVEIDPNIESARLVTGSVVVSVDYFKAFMASLRNLFGGEVRSYTPLLDRARREAILRMKEAALDCQMIINVRIETSTIGSGETGEAGALQCVEIIAYGTAIRLRQQAAA